MCDNHPKFSERLTELFREYQVFELRSYDSEGIETTVAKFKTKSFDIEIFGQDLSINKQYVYRHMIIENNILNKEGEAFRSNILRLKFKGIKIEVAFALLLGLNRLKGKPL